MMEELKEEETGDLDSNTVDLSDLRGTRNPYNNDEEMIPENADLHALAELVPRLKSGASKENKVNYSMTVDTDDHAMDQSTMTFPNQNSVMNVMSQTTPTGEELVLPHDGSMVVQNNTMVDDEDLVKKIEPNTRFVPQILSNDASPIDEEKNSNFSGYSAGKGGGNGGIEACADDSNSNILDNPYLAGDDPRSGAEPYAGISSGGSISTATMTQGAALEAKMPMSLPTFKPATGCTNASDFTIRCFVARLRSGITVVKHGRSRWSKSRLRVLHLHIDGQSLLTWKAAPGENPSKRKRPARLDLSTCSEVRHAWSPDPLNPMYTGTPILRSKCETANAHKSFALVFPKRTVDITALTADQCKVLMEGFSALCFRLHMNNQKQTDQEEVATTTASVTLTNNSKSSLIPSPLQVLPTAAMR